MIASRLRLVGYGAALVAGLVVAGIVAWQARTINTRDKTIREMMEAAGKLREANERCATDVTEQNTAIAELRAKGEAEQRRADAARAEADRIGAQTQRRVQQAMAAAVPTECPAAMEWLRDKGESLAREWNGVYP